MNERKIVFTARPLVILLGIVLLVSVVCGTVAAEKYVYVPIMPSSGGDPTVEVNPSLESALAGSGDIIVLTDNVSLKADAVINGTKTLISYYPQGLTVDANAHTITIPADTSLTLGTGINEVNINGGKARSYLINVIGSLTMQNQVNLQLNDASVTIVQIDGGDFMMSGGKIDNNTLVTGTVSVLNGGNFRMTGGTIANNTASGAAGGIFIGDGSAAAMSDGVIANNSGISGGVSIASNGGFTLSGGKIEWNTASESGGGVYISDGGQFTQNGGEITFNTAYYDGGAVWLAASQDGTGAQYTLNDGSLNNNTAGDYGGAVYLSTNYASSVFTFSNGEIVNNSAETGGAVYLSTFAAPFFERYYGNNYYEGAKFSMVGGLIANNSAKTAGGVFVGGKQVKMPEARYTFVPSVFEMSGGVITNTSNNAVYVSSGKFIMNGGEITANNYPANPVYINDAKNYDPSLNVMHQGMFEMNGGEIYDNYGDRPYVYNNGGHIEISDGDIFFSGLYYNGSYAIENTKTGNLELSGNGGISGFMNNGVKNSGTFNMTGGVIFDNSGWMGGGIYNTGNLSVSGGSVYNNTAKEGNGGGIYSINPVNMSGGLIAENNATNGGGIHALCLNISGGEISSNKADDYGGGVFAEFVNMSGGSISKNKADYGGAVVFKQDLNMTGGLISSNSALEGGGLYLTNVSKMNMLFSMYGGTIQSNTASKGGSGIYFTHGDFKLGDAGRVDGSNEVLIGQKKIINVVSNLSNSAGVYDITPTTTSPQTVVQINVPGRNATEFKNNFNANPNYNLNPSDTSLITSLKPVTPTPFPGADNGIQYLGDVLYSVTFDPNNGTNLTETYNVKYGSLITPPEDPVNGYASFVGWFTAFGYQWNFETDTIESSIVLYANWEGSPSPLQPIATQAGETSSPAPLAGILLGAAAAAVILLRGRNR